MDSEPIIGIDLGTTNSEVAILSGGRPEVVREDGDPILPSCVGLARRATSSSGAGPATRPPPLPSARCSPSSA